MTWIAIYGAGGVGGYFGARLARAGRRCSSARGALTCAPCASTD
jgi:hypothetical protein